MNFYILEWNSTMEIWGRNKQNIDKKNAVFSLMQIKYLFMCEKITSYERAKLNYR